MTAPLRRWENLFRITNAAGLRAEVDLYEVRGLASGDTYDRTVDQLRGVVQHDLQLPVAALREGERTLLALPSWARPKSEYVLMPLVASLQKCDHTTVDIGNLTERTTPIAVRYLEYMLRAPLRADLSIWSIGRTYYRKTPLNVNDRHASIDVYGGFSWNVIVREGECYLALDVTNGYAQRAWLIDQWKGDAKAFNRQFARRMILYHFGPRWYQVRLKEATGQSISQERFALERNGERRIVDVFSYTRETYPNDPLVRDLDPDGPAIRYENGPGARDSSAILALAKLSVRTEDAAGLQRSAILVPQVRMDRIQAVVTTQFQRARFFNMPIAIASTPLEIEARTFTVPALRFGNDHVLMAGDGPAPAGAERVPLADLGSRRLRLLLDQRVGPINRQAFGPQYLFVPEPTVPRGIVDTFLNEFERQMREISGRPEYRIELVQYTDKSPSLPEQRQAVREVVRERCHGRGGHGLFILPPGAHRELHNHLEQDMYPALQLQCVDAVKLRTFFVTRDEQYVLADDQRGVFRSYVRNCVLPMLELNRHWLWALASPLNFDLHIGLDVLNATAGLTLVADSGRAISFSDHKAIGREKLGRGQLRTILVNECAAFLRPLGLRPRSVLVHRDGRTYPSELQAIDAAVAQLQQQDLLAFDARVAVVELRKHNSSGLRIVEGSDLKGLRNPRIGSHDLFTPSHGVIALTGYPFALRGTANPLSVHLVKGEGPLEPMLHDIFALSQLAFTGPEHPSKVPITIKLCDDFLRPVAAHLNVGAGLYEDDDGGEEEAGEPEAPESEVSS